MGSGQLCQAELRPLAFSMLAELVHHARGNLSADQLNHTVHLFCRCAAMPLHIPIVTQWCEQLDNRRSCAARQSTRFGV